MENEMIVLCVRADVIQKKYSSCLMNLVRNILPIMLSTLC